MSQPLEGKTALVTGASAGIGAATARALAAAGARLVLAARRQDRLRSLAASLSGGGALAVPADCSVAGEIDQLMEQAVAFGGGALDIVIVNAGFGLAGGVVSSDRQRWEALIQTNVIGAAHLMRRAAEHMLPRKRGDIVAISSVAGINVSPFSGFYGSSKFAVAALAEALRREVCQSGIRVSTIKPAIVESEFQQVAGYGEQFGKATQRFGKLLAPADVAAAIAFVLSQPPHVHINDLMIRPVGQDYP